MRNFSILGGVAALTIAAASASAYDFPNLAVSKAMPASPGVNMIHQGVWLGTVAGSISSTNSTTSSSITVEPGYMVTDNIAVGVKFAYMSAGSFNSNTIFGSVRYYFDPAGKQWVPFVGPFIGYSKSNQGGNAATIYGGNVGIEFFLAPNVSFTPSVNYLRTTASGVNTNTWSLAFGLTFWYGGK